MAPRESFPRVDVGVRRRIASMRDVGGNIADENKFVGWLMRRNFGGISRGLKVGRLLVR